MNNEYYAVASTPSEDFLAHYGVRGMKWGVRKAVQRGSERRLSRNFSKAERKLAKLTKRANGQNRFRKSAGRLAAGAAVAGGLALAGTAGVAKGIAKSGRIAATASRKAGRVAQKIGHKAGVAALTSPVRGAVQNAATMASVGVANAGRAMERAGRLNLKNRGGIYKNAVKAANAVRTWGNQTSSLGSVVKKAGGAVANVGRSAGNAALTMKGNGRIKNAAISAARGVREAGKSIQNASGRLSGLSKGTVAKYGAAAVGAGLAAAAAHRMYKAAKTDKYREKASNFEREKNKAFAGTSYANGRPVKKKRRR